MPSNEVTAGKTYLDLITSSVVPSKPPPPKTKRQRAEDNWKALVCYAPPPFGPMCPLHAVGEGRAPPSERCGSAHATHARAEWGLVSWADPSAAAGRTGAVTPHLYRFRMPSSQSRRNFPRARRREPRYIFRTSAPTDAWPAIHNRPSHPRGHVSGVGAAPCPAPRSLQAPPYRFHRTPPQPRPSQPKLARFSWRVLRVARAARPRR
jgi:hypothetical protein